MLRLFVIKLRETKQERRRRVIIPLSQKTFRLKKIESEYPPNGILRKDRTDRRRHLRDGYEMSAQGHWSNRCYQKI